MTSPFSRLMDYAVECQFKRDPGGRLVFFPYSRRKQAYFIDSKPDEDKIRSFVKIYRTASTLLSWMSFPSTFVPVVILEDYAGLSPQRHRLAIVIGISLFFWLVLGALQWMLWAAYKKTVPNVTSSLSEVGPDVRARLIIVPTQRRVRLVALGAFIVCLGLLILILFLVSARPHSRALHISHPAACTRG
jgi:hypothetical protein